MSLNDIVQASVSIANANGPQGPGLVTPIIAGYHNHYADRVRLYATSSMLQQMVTDGFATTEPIYKAAQKVCGALAAPATCCIGRRALAPQQTLKLTCLDGTVNDAYNVTVVSSTGVTTNLVYTNVAQGSTIAELTGTVAVTNGAAAITFSTNQTITAGTLIAFASQPGVYYVVSAAVTAATAGTLTANYSGPTAAATTSLVQQAISGTVAVTNGSTGVTFSVAQTFAAGDLLTFASQPGVYYALSAAVVSSTAGTLTAAYAGVTAASSTAQHLATLSVTGHTINGSASVTMSATPVGQVAVGDSVVFASQLGVSYTVAVVTSTTLTLTTPYTGAGATTDHVADVCSATTAATALTGQLQAITNYAGTVGAVSVSGAVITISRTDGNLTDVQGWLANGFASLSLQDTTADPGIATDLAAMQAANGGAWFAVILDSNSSAEIQAAAAWCEATGAQGKVLFANNSDIGNLVTPAPSPPDLNTALNTAGYTRTFVEQNNQQLLSYGGASIGSYALSQTPGSYNLAFKSQPGVPADSDTTLTEGQALILNTMTASAPGPGGKKGNYYKFQGGQPYLFPGCAPSGQFFDLTIGVTDLLIAMQVASVAYFAGLPKVPFDQFGLNGLGQVIYGVLVSRSALPYGLILPNGADPTRPIKVNVPPITSYTSAQRAARIMTGFTWSAGLQGAADGAVIQGTLNP